MVAGFILRPGGVECFPVADIGPAHVGRDHRRAGRVFHHRIVDAFAFDRGEGCRVRMEPVALYRAEFDRPAYCRRNRRAMLCQFAQEKSGAERKNSAVPRIFARFDELPRPRQIGLFDELRHPRARPGADHVAALEIAEAGFRGLRLDPEADQPVLRGQVCRRQCCPHEGGAVGDVVIARADQHHRVCRQAERRQRDGRRSVTGRWLDDRLRAGGTL